MSGPDGAHRRRMIRFSQLKGQRVIARRDGQMAGSVRRLLLDVPSASVTAIELEGIPDGENIVAWKDVSAVGPDAVMIESLDVRHRPLTELEQRFAGGELSLEDKLVLTDAGDALGPLTDLGFDARSGRVHELEVPGHVVPVDRVVALGRYALIVPEPESADGPSRSSSPRKGTDSQSGRLLSS